MYTAALLALAPIAAQAAQSARWPVFNLRANVTQQFHYYGSAGVDTRAHWHNAPLTASGGGDITGPLVDEDSTCTARAGLTDHAPYTLPYFFYPRSTTTGQYAPSEMVAGSYKMKIAQKNQADANGRRAVVMSSCGAGSTSIYISATEPYHLTYDNKEAKKPEKFGSFYLCDSSNTGDHYAYGDALFYRSADEKTPKECGEVIFYPECMPLSYTVTTTQGTSQGTIDDGRNKAGHYNATCYVDVKDVAGAPNTDISEWMTGSRTRYEPLGKIHV